MKRFAELFRELDETTSTNAKVSALVRYFEAAPPADAAWAVYFLSGRRRKRLVNTRQLREWVAEASGYPLWLVEDCYESVGDLAETMALLLDDPARDPVERSLSDWVEHHIDPLARLEENDKREAVKQLWRMVDAEQRFIVNKLITGAFRVGVSRRLVTRALSQFADIDPAIIAHRLMGDWQPSARQFQRWIDPDGDPADETAPYPFFLASPLEQRPAELGELSGWLVEWKWDGIRAQLIRRGGQMALWSRGEERLDGRFPEIEADARSLPDGVVLDGEILAWRDGRPLPFQALQKRIGRKKVGPKVLEDAPCIFLAYDLLEHGGRDLRETPVEERRAALARVAAEAGPAIDLSSDVEAGDWESLDGLRQQSRERGVEGFILKRRGSPYRTGRTRGDWWKWKIDPYTIDAVLIYAQPGHGRRSNLFTDYTFAVHHGEKLVPVAKAYSGLDQAEIERLDRWIRRNTLERFGPVRSVKPEHVFEIAFEGINRSPRHKSGIALRFPRVHRWREDLNTNDADRLEDVHRLLPKNL